MLHFVIRKTNPPLLLKDLFSAKETPRGTPVVAFQEQRKATYK